MRSNKEERLMKMVAPTEEEIKESELEEKRKQLQALKMEKERLKMEAEVEATKKELEQLKSSKIPTEGISGIVASLVKSGLTPEQVNEFLGKLSPEALATMAALSSNNPILPMMMFLASQSSKQSSQPLTARDIVEINKSILETGKVLASGGKEEPSWTKVLEILQNLYSQNLQRQIDELKSSIKQEGLWDRIMGDDAVWKRLESLIKGREMTPEALIQLEKLRHEHDLALKNLELQILRLQEEMSARRERGAQLEKVIKSIGEAVVEGTGGGKEEELSYPEAKCPNCGSPIPITGEVVTCLKCGKKYKVEK